VTFRYIDPKAEKVSLDLDVVAKPIAMSKDDAGMWSVTTEALPPEIYEYHFTSDGEWRVDPNNPKVGRNFISLWNSFTVQGDSPEPWEMSDVPHGTLHHSLYGTAISLGLPSNQTEYYVYTPPSYDAKARKPYPVLYLLHGWSDDASAWVEKGKANLILDNLLAAGKIKPMVVVMPLGYGDRSFLSSMTVWRQPEVIDHNTELYEKALLAEVMPRVESEYNISRRREERAIAGSSMGGLESLTVGLQHPEMFAWVAGLSSAVHAMNYAAQLSSLDPKTANLRLLWVACGSEDSLIGPNRKLRIWLKNKGMPVTDIETQGAHTWPVWRDNLVHLAPLLFQDTK
jgi:enterochelin esterase family protein